MIQEAILASLIIDKWALEQAMPFLKSEYFDSKNRELFNVIQSIHGRHEPVDTITLCKRIGKSSWQISDVLKLTTTIASGVNIMAYVQQLKSDYVARQYSLLTGRPELTVDDPGQKISELIDSLRLLQEDHIIGGQRDFVDVVNDALNELTNETNSVGMIGIPTPSTTINRDTKGLRGGNLIVLAGRPSMGKTAFALSIVRSACESKMPVAYFSMEMSDISLTKRLICAYPDHETGAGIVSSYPLHIFDRGGQDIDYIKSNVRLLDDCKLVVIDYLGLMRLNSTISRREAIGEATRGLKAFAREMDIPVLLLSQLNRDVESRGGLLHRLSDLRESGDIEQDADQVFFITRPAFVGDEKSRDVTDMRVIIQKEKDRNGKAPRVFNLVSDDLVCKFYDESDLRYITEHKDYKPIRIESADPF